MKFALITICVTLIFCQNLIFLDVQVNAGIPVFTGILMAVYRYSVFAISISNFGINIHNMCVITFFNKDEVNDVRKFPIKL